MLVQSGLWTQVNECYFSCLAQMKHIISSSLSNMLKIIEIDHLMCLFACFNLWLVNLPSPNVPPSEIRPH